MDKERKPHKHTEAATSSPLLSIRGLSAAYDGRTVLHDVDLEVYEHDFLGIIGPNGGGKTTLIKCILGLLRPTGGEIIKYHEPLTTGYLPQYNSIDRSFPISVLEVVLSGLSSKKSLTGRFNDRHREKARQVIHRMGLEGLEHRAIGQLSGGQLQRALLGRAIISDPQLLILDEPSTYIDKRFEARLYQLLAEIQPRLQPSSSSAMTSDGAATGKEHRLRERNTGLSPGRKRQHRMAGTELQLPDRAAGARHTASPGAGRALSLPRGWQSLTKDALFHRKKLRPALLHLLCEVMQGGVFAQSSFLSQGTIVSLHREARFPRVRKTSFPRIRL